MEKPPVIGIHLGENNSCVGVFQQGIIEIIANDEGNSTTPSWVAFTHNKRLVGEAAKNQANDNPENTVWGDSLGEVLTMSWKAKSSNSRSML